MDDSNEALSVDGSAEESGGHSSDNLTEEAGYRRLKLQGKDDRISALPDSLIRHIISFLPSTKQAIQTGILSKRWRYQWSRVPVLIFDSIGKNDRNFSQFIDRTLILHDCSNLKKFQIKYYNHLKHDPQLAPKILFATRKHVEELILHVCPKEDYQDDDPYILPEFLCSNDALVKLELFNCYFHRPLWINWPSLKELKLECSSLLHRANAINFVIRGCPLLESLELTQVYHLLSDVIASKSLKRLIIMDADCDNNRDHFVILCPNLEELSIKISYYYHSSIDYSTLPDQMIEYVLSNCPLLHTLELMNVNCSERFVIASKSLKKLVLGELPQTLDIEISCPNLEESDLCQFEPPYKAIEDLEIKMLEQLRHVKQLHIGVLILKSLSALEMEGQSSPLVYCKCLILDGVNFDELLLGIICVIRSSPMLEKLVIKFHKGNLDIEDYWNSKGILFNCSVSNLKTLKLVDLAEVDKRELVFDFVEFVLKNSRVLELIVVTLEKPKPGFVFEVSKKLLGFQRCYPHTIFELHSSSECPNM